MRIFYPLPALPRNGGIKACIQHAHLLNADGVETYIATPEPQPTPYPQYEKARFVTWDRCLETVAPEDRFVFCWAESIRPFLHLTNKFYFFSQGVINKSDPVPHTVWLRDRFDLLTIGRHSRDFFFYGYGRESKMVGNWIDERVFFPDSTALINNRVGMLRHREHFDGELRHDLERLGLSVQEIAGTENEVAAQMRTCGFFLGCSAGVFNGHDHAEGFSLPGAEAMASGALLITYNNQGCLEYAFDRVNSFVAWKNTRQDLLDCLTIARKSPLADRLRENGVFTIRQRFNAERITAQLMAALQLQERRPACAY